MLLHTCTHTRTRTHTHTHHSHTHCLWLTMLSTEQLESNNNSLSTQPKKVTQLLCQRVLASGLPFGMPPLPAGTAGKHIPALGTHLLWAVMPCWWWHRGFDSHRYQTLGCCHTHNCSPGLLLCLDHLWPGPVLLPPAQLLQPCHSPRATSVSTARRPMLHSRQLPDLWSQ
jgi:hypothetical protein